MLTSLRDWISGRDLERRLLPTLADPTRSLGISVPTSELGRPLWPERSIESLRREATASPVVYACVTARAKAVSAAPLRVYRDAGGGQREELPDHPVAQLLRRPNPTVSEAEFLLTTVLMMDVAGFCLIEKVRSGQGNVVELWHLRSEWARPIARGDGAFDWEYRVPGRVPVVLAAEDAIVVTSTPSLTLGATGISPTAVALREIGIDSASTEFLKLFFDSGAAPRYALVSPNPITDQAKADAIRERWRQTYGGYGNWTQVALLHGGLDVRPIGYDLNEMAYPELRRLLEARICMTFGVPPILVGAQVGLDASTYSNFEEARRTFYEDTIVPLWARIDGALTRSLLPELESDRSVSLEFDTSNIAALQEDVTPAWQRATAALAAGAITLNQAQLEMGLPGFGPDGEVVFLPGTALPVRVVDLATVDALPPDPVATGQATAAVPGAASQNSIETGTGFVTARALPVETAADAVERPVSTLETRAASAAGNRRTQARLAIRLVPELRKFWREQGRRIASVAARSAPGAEARALDEVDWAEELRLLGDVLERHYLRAGEAAYRSAAAELGIGISWSLENPGPRRLVDRLGTRIVGISETTRQDVARVLAEEMATGTSPQQMAAAIEDLFAQTYKNRALTVGRTESQFGYNVSAAEAYRESGVVAQVQLFDNDAHTEDYGAQDGWSCAERNGKVVPLADAEFHVASEHVNGSLAISPIPVGVGEV